jgi:hypothetical protein
MVWMNILQCFYPRRANTLNSAMDQRKKTVQDTQKPRLKSQRKSTHSRRLSANQKERRRTQNINFAFAELRRCIPNVPQDTKLSKIRTLRLATSYIGYLQEVLQAETRRDAGNSPSPISKNARTVNLHSSGNYKATILAVKVTNRHQSLKCSFHFLIM